jgi:hypothetical protein
MSLFTNEEKQFVKESLTIYLQMASQQVPPQMLEQLGEVAKTILLKVDKAGSGDLGEGGNKPPNISDEWFEKVCQECDKLDYSGCTDSITAKFPGKCDPILKYEFVKNRQG